MTGLPNMATISENADIAVLQNQMGSVITGIAAINTKLDIQTKAFVPRGEFDEFKKRWALSHALVSVISLVFAAVVTAYFTTVHK